MKTNDFSLKNYFNHYKSVYGLITTLLCSIPIISSVFSDNIERYLFPPLGNFDTFGRICSIVLVLLVTMVVYFAKDLAIIQEKQKRFFLLVKMIVITISFYLIFFVLNVSYVKTLTLPDENKTTLNVSIGYDRQKSIRDSLVNATDYDILTKERGPDEKEIQRVWTMPSLIIVRLGLLVSYIGFFVVAVAISSLLILFDFNDTVVNKNKKPTKTKEPSENLAE